VRNLATRSSQKQQAIVDAAATHFLSAGYQGTSMDEIAATAGVSKQTIYKHFADKERLFEACVLGALDRAGDPFRAEIAAMLAATDLSAGLLQLATAYLETILRPEVLAFRRMVIGEAGRLPELARAYYERAPERTMAALADGFARVAERGALQIDDPEAAARHFAFLVIGPVLDRSLFCGDQPLPAVAEVEAAVRVFVTAYGPRTRG
jgi:TetR/AcrR family transcriptional regulator, mexJK operon transcriptional repressor